MAEDARDRETQTIVPNLFPLGKEPILAAFRDLSPAENPSACQEAIDEETDIFRQTNPHAFNHFSDLAQTMGEQQVAEEAVSKWSSGIMLCHRALREQAKLKGGVLPTFTGEFTEGYNEQGLKKTKAMSLDKEIGFQDADAQLSKMQLVKFKNWEPELNEPVREKLGLQSDRAAEDDLVCSGIIHLYLLFRAGCSDPKNFQK